jgi:hypothetical protein
MKKEQVKVVPVAKSSFSTVRWRQIDLRTEYFFATHSTNDDFSQKWDRNRGRFSWSWTRQASNGLRVYHRILTKDPVKVLHQIQDLKWQRARSSIPRGKFPY